MRYYISIHFIPGHICESNIDLELSVIKKLLILTDIREKLISSFYKHVILISSDVNENFRMAWGGAANDMRLKFDNEKGKRFILEIDKMDKKLYFL